MVTPDEPSLIDVDNLLHSWISAPPSGSSQGVSAFEATERSATSSQPDVPPRVSGLLQGTLVSDAKPYLSSAVTGSASFVQHAGSPADVKRPGDQAGTNRTLEPEGQFAQKRSKHTGQSAAEPTTRNSEVNRRAQKKFRQKQKVHASCTIVFSVEHYHYRNVHVSLHCTTMQCMSCISST